MTSRFFGEEAVSDFAAQWCMHQRVAAAVFHGLREWFGVNAGQSVDRLPLGLRVDGMTRALKRIVASQVALLGGALPKGARNALLAWGLHEVCTQHGVGVHDPFGLLLWETIHSLFVKSIFALESQEGCIAGPYSLLEAAKPYAGMCELIVKECVGMCGSGSPHEQMGVVGERFVWRLLHVGGALPCGYNSVHLAFAVMKAAEDASMHCRECRALLHLGCISTLRISTMEYGGVPRVKLLKSAKSFRRAAATFVQYAGLMSVMRRRDEDWMEMYDFLTTMMDRAEPSAGGIGCLMLEIQRQLPPDARRSKTGTVLWRLFHKRTAQGLFPLEVYTSAAIPEMAEALLGQAAYVCTRFRDERRRMRVLNEMVDEFCLSPEWLATVVRDVQARLPSISRSSRAAMQLWRLFQKRSGVVLFSLEEYEGAITVELARATQLRLAAAVVMCEGVSALCACSGVRPALEYAQVWLRSRRMGFDRIARQREAITAAMRLPEGVPAWHAIVPIVIAAAFQAVYAVPFVV